MEGDSTSCNGATELLDAYLDRQLTHSLCTSSMRNDINSELDHESLSSTGVSYRTGWPYHQSSDRITVVESGNDVIDYDRNSEDEIDRFRRRLQSSDSLMYPSERLSVESEELLQNLQMLKNKCQKVLSIHQSSNPLHTSNLEDRSGYALSDRDRESYRSGVKHFYRSFGDDGRINRIRNEILNRSITSLDRFIVDNDTDQSTLDSFPSTTPIDRSADRSSRLTADDIRRIHPDLFSSS